MTGSNKGIGFAIVKELCAKFDGVVYLTSRNEELGRAAVAEFEKIGLHPRYHQLDIDDEFSVFRLRYYFNSTYGGLDVLINNAAIGFWPDCGKTLHEMVTLTLGTNFFNTQTLCQVLFPLLRPGSRVVNLSSSIGHLSVVPNVQLRHKFSSPDLTLEQLNSLMRQYIQKAFSFNSTLCDFLKTCFRDIQRRKSGRLRSKGLA